MTIRIFAAYLPSQSYGVAVNSLLLIYASRVTLTDFLVLIHPTSPLSYFFSPPPHHTTCLQYISILSLIYWNGGVHIYRGGWILSVRAYMHVVHGHLYMFVLCFKTQKAKPLIYGIYAWMLRWNSPKEVFFSIICEKIIA